MKDKVFSKPIKKQFEFDEEVVSVFDDMLNRSVPFYNEVLNLTSDFIILNTKKDDIVYDLGSSTASTLIEIYRKSPHNLEMIGIDSSKAMIKRGNYKLKAIGSKNIKLVKNDFLKIELQKSKAIISNYTLQFIRPLYREKLIKKIFNSLKKDGIFIFSEKVICDDKILNKQFIDKYFEFKKLQGYTKFEIAQKREALENVLVPYTDIENRKMVLKAGFKSVDILFKWLNFSTFIARK